MSDRTDSTATADAALAESRKGCYCEPYGEVYLCEFHEGFEEGYDTAERSAVLEPAATALIEAALAEERDYETSGALGVAARNYKRAYRAALGSAEEAHGG